jgi:hypothetical protein
MLHRNRVCLVILSLNMVLLLRALDVTALPARAERGMPSAAADYPHCRPETVQILYFDDFESEESDWLARGTHALWELQGERTYSGQRAYHVRGPNRNSESRLDSPDVALPADAEVIRFSFWHYRNMESDGETCYDGGVIGISTDSGGIWEQIQERSLLSDPYNGHIVSGTNPLGARDGWCGNPPEWREVVADVSAYKGRTARFRFHFASNLGVASEGWYVDDVMVIACELQQPIYLPVVLRGQPGFCLAREQEPNNTSAQALMNPALCPGIPIEGVLADEADQRDIYRMEVEQGGAIVVRLTNIPPGTNYDLYLYDNRSELPFAASTRPGNEPEQVEFMAQPGTYFASVVANSGRSSSPYTIQWQWAGQSR